MTMPATRLNREVFHTSRLLEFCSQKELVAQTGHEVKDWPLVIIKELVDNGLDSAEEHNIAPVVAISISTATGEIIVTDNGPGIATATIDGILDYTVRVSSREAYPNPSRGRQGNALKTIIAIPYVLDGSAGETVIEAQGATHRIDFRTDAIRQEPRVCCDRGSSTVKNGTRVTVRLPAKACHLLDGAARFLPFVRTYIALNPHLAISLDVDGERVIDCTNPTNPDWQKWKPSDPIPAQWYTPETLQRYMAACISRDRECGNRVRSVRDFVAGFRGLSGTAKQKQVLDETNLFRAPLDDFFVGNQANNAGIGGLLTVMQRHSSPVKPQALGTIGKEHFRDVIVEGDGAHPESFKYHRVLDTDRDGLPFVVEAAFASASTTSRIAGVNWSPGIVNPFRSLSSWQSLDSVLREQHVDGDDPVVMVVHLACPVVQFTDRGKSAATLNYQQSAGVINAVRTVTKPWHDDTEAALREWHRRANAAERVKERDRIELRKEMREIHRREKLLLKERRSAERRARAEVVGTGLLYREIAFAADGGPLNALTVLSRKNDPYRLDNTEGHANGKWFADQVARFVPDQQQMHLRGLHYCIVVATDVKRPDGTPYVNDDRCWKWLQAERGGEAGAVARLRAV
jgi:hypothetical protein